MELKQGTRRVLDALNEWFASNSAPPTLRELSQKAGFSSTWPLRHHLKKLADMGYISVKKGLSRGIEPVKNMRGIPLLGRISAGLPIDAVENVEEHIDSISEMFGLRDMFALRVAGDSMIGAGIYDGDTVIIRKQRTASEGEIVAALLGSEATVKRFYKTAEGVKLVAENPKYNPIISKEARVMGKVVGVIRKIK
jgi:repressor LexA